MTGYADIHCHALYGVDDGACDINESLAILRFMHDEGIRTVIMTPHYHGGRCEPAIDRVENHFAKLQQTAADDDKLGDMDLHLGCEIYYYPSIIEWLDEGRVATMAGSSYVLLEFGYTMEKRMITEGVGAVVNAGYRPVIAHVERYRKLVGDMKAMDELLEMGALIQINTGAFYEGFKIRSFIKKLLKNEMVHFVATDAHDDKNRAPYISQEARYIAKHYGEDYCRRLLIENPAAVIRNDPIS